MTQAAALRADLQALFGAEGRSLVVSHSTPGAYDPATGATAAATVTTIAGVGRIGDYSDRVIDGTLIQAGDRRCTFVPDDIAAIVSVGDSVIDGAKTSKVISVKTRELNALICYTMQVRA